MTEREIYEYAGFKYQVIHDGDKIRLEAMPNQHRAAKKEKHIRNATQMYLEEKKRSSRALNEMVGALGKTLEE